MNKHIKQINIQSEVFENLRKQFDEVVQRTLTNMETKNCDHAEISVRLSVDIVKYEDLYREKDGTTMKTLVRKPVFAHKVASAMRIKDSVEGIFCEDYELVHNGLEFVLVPIGSGQTSLFEEDEK